MFGYVMADISKLSEPQKSEYRAVYCGVCRSLRDRYGIAAEMTLNYDLVFLAMLLMGVYKAKPEIDSRRCLPHPGHAHAAMRHELIDYAADMGLVLAYYKCLDDWQDDKNILKLTESRLTENAVRKLGQTYPRQCAKIRECLDALSEAENRDERNPDIPANIFGSLMGEVFVKEQDDLAALLWETGNQLGRFIYLLDAVMDMKEDLKKRAYNPMTGIAVEMHDSILYDAMGRCCAVYEQLPVDKYKGILDNILYSGVWLRRKMSGKKHGEEGDADERSVSGAGREPDSQ